VSYEDILFEKSGQIGIIMLNRPDRLNAFTWTMGNEMRDALVAVDEAPELRVTIITGAGRGFCAGADLGGGGRTFESRNPRETAEAERGERPKSNVEFYVAAAERVNRRYFRWIGQQPAARERVVSFMEKRRPTWSMKVPGDMPDF
jgi:enoyl-CoA hydratase/carnithine racemase